MLPEWLLGDLKPVTVIVGHYGSGKTNFTMNVALDAAKAGKRVTVIDMDIVNPYFRVSEQRRILEDAGVELVAPVFSEAGTSLDVPSLTGRILPAIESAGDERLVLVDVGGDDAGSIAIGRYARAIVAAGKALEGDYRRVCIELPQKRAAKAAAKELQKAGRSLPAGAATNDLAAAAARRAMLPAQPGDHDDEQTAPARPVTPWGDLFKEAR